MRFAKAGVTGIAGPAFFAAVIRFPPRLRAPQRLDAKSAYRGGRDPILENLAVALGGFAKAARRDAGGAMEGADEVREIVEAGVHRDVGDRAVALGQQARGAAQTGANQVLMRRDA